MQNPGSLLSGREGKTQMKLLYNYIMNHVHFKTHSRMGCSEAVWRVGEADFRLCGLELQRGELHCPGEAAGGPVHGGSIIHLSTRLWYEQRH